MFCLDGCLLCLHALHFPTLRGLHPAAAAAQVVFSPRMFSMAFQPAPDMTINRIRFPGRFRFAPLACRCQPLSMHFPLSSAVSFHASLRDHHPGKPHLHLKADGPVWPYTFTGMLSTFQQPSSSSLSLSLLLLHVLTLRRSPRAVSPQKSTLLRSASRSLSPARFSPLCPRQVAPGLPALFAPAPGLLASPSCTASLCHASPARKACILRPQSIPSTLESSSPRPHCNYF